MGSSSFPAAWGTRDGPMSEARRASLSMYDLPELRASTDAWWRGLAQAFRDAGLQSVPDALTRGVDLETLWLSSDLLLGQTCGYPLTHVLAGRVTLVATPVFAVEGCEGPHYRSALIVRRDDDARHLADLRGRRAAVNYRGSHSGWNILRHEVAPLAEAGSFFAEVVDSGSHGGSMAAVAEGRADLAAVD